MSLFTNAQQFIAGGVNSPVRAFAGVGGEPVFFKSASGARVQAEDGREYIDYVGSWGPMVLGHAHPEIIETVRSAAEAAGRADADFDIGYMPPWSYLLAPSVPEGVPAMLAGAEALAADIRAARAVGANSFHLKFRSRDLAEYLDQIEAFSAEVVPLVDEP